MPTFTTTTISPQSPSSSPAEPASTPTTPQVSPTEVVGSQPTVTKVAKLPESRGAAESSRPASTVENPVLVKPDAGSQVVSIIAGLSSDNPSIAPDRTVAQHITRANPGDPVSNLITLGGVPVSITLSGSFAIIEDYTLTPGGSPVTTSGQNIKLVSNGLEIASSTTALFSPVTPRPNSQPADQILIPTESTPISAMRSGSAILLSQGAATATLLPGQTITFGEQELSALPLGVGLQVNSGTIWLFDTGLPQSRLDIGGQAATALRLDERYTLLVSGSQTTVLSNGAEVDINGATIKALADGSGVIVESSSLLPLSREQSSGDKVKNYDFSAQGSGRYVIIVSDGTTAAVENSAATVFDEHVVSVARDGRFAVIDGTRTETVALGTPTSKAINENADVGEDETGSAESTIVTAGALGKRLLFSVWRVSVCVVVAVLALI